MQTFDSLVITFDLSGDAVADLCAFDSSLTTFDSSRTFDATTCQGGAPQPQPEVEQPAAGGRPRRKRYLLPNDVLVWATPNEIQDILEEFVEVEQPKPKPKTKKQKRKAKHEPFVPVEIHFEPMPDFSVQTFRPVIPKTWKPDWKSIYQAVEKLKRRIDDEEAILLLL